MGLFENKFIASVKSCDHVFGIKISINLLESVK